VNDAACLTCGPKGQACIACNDGFALVNGTCRPCLGTNCLACRASGKCTKCASSAKGPSYGLTPEGTCNRCKSDGCVACASNWQKCSRCLSSDPVLQERGYVSDGMGGCKQVGGQ
jgi:hypothetical protein